MPDEGEGPTSGQYKGTWKSPAGEPEGKQQERVEEVQAEDPEVEADEAPPSIPSKSHIVTAFPEEWKEDFQSLCYLGYLTTEVTIPHHSWLLRTLYPGEKLEVAQVIKKYQDSIGYNLAWKCALVAAAMITCDGEAIIVAERSTGVLPQKFQYVVNEWYEPIIEMLHHHLKLLEARQVAIMTELGIFSASDEALQAGKKEIEEKLEASS